MLVLRDDVSILGHRINSELSWKPYMVLFPKMHIGHIGLVMCTLGNGNIEVKPLKVVSTTFFLRQSVDCNTTRCSS